MCVLMLMQQQSAFAADITVKNSISCVSGEFQSMGRRIQTTEIDDSDPQILDWNMKENFGNGRSKVTFIWTPESDRGPTIKLETTDRPHNLIKIRSHTKSSLIFASSTSNFYSAESWTFVINFNVETMIATRVISNIAGVGSEQITYHCDLESPS